MSKNKKGSAFYYIDDYTIPRYPVLSHEETIDLIKKYKNGDQEAGKKVIERNYGLVVKECLAYSNNKISKMELFQEGCLGLMTALDRFDLESNNTFGTYAIWWVRQRISKYGAENSYSLTIGQDIYRLINRINHLESLLSIRYGRTPTRDEIAMELGVSREKIDAAMIAYTEEISMDKPLSSNGEESEGNLAEFIPASIESPEDKLAEKDKREVILEVLDKVCKDEKEKEIIMKRFGLDDGEVKRLHEIAKEYNVTRERIRQIEAKVIRKIKLRYKNVLKPYYDE